MQAAPAKRARRSAGRPRGPDDERLKEPPLGVASDDPEGQERREDDAEEEDREHRQPEDRRPGQRLGVDPDLTCLRSESRCLLEGAVGAETVQGEKRRRQDQDHDEDSPSDRFPQGVADHRNHVASSPTASR